MKHVILLTSAHESPATLLFDILRGAGINAWIEVLRERQPPELRTGAPRLRIREEPDDPLAVLWEVVPDADLEEMRLAIRHAGETWAGVPLVACRRPASEYERRHSSIVGSQLLKRMGFLAIADDPAQLPALLRTLETIRTTGDLRLSSDQPAGNRADLFPWLPANLPAETLRAAFELVASLHFASDQKSVAQTALAGFAEVVPATRWTIYLTPEATSQAASALETLAVNFRDGVEHQLLESTISGALAEVSIENQCEASRAAREAAVRTEPVRLDEDGKQVLAIPMLSGERVPGVVEAVREGNYATPFTPAEIDLVSALVVPVASALVNSVRIAEAERMSQTDDLTKLHNARYLRQCVLNEVKRARRYNSSVTVFFLDLDDFKRVNDEHGHLVGSHVLMEMAMVILASVRDTDIVARYGGDEFVIVLPETGLEMATGVAERVRTMIADNLFTGGRHLQLSITASFGVANFPVHAQSPQQLVAFADSAMYEAKAASKNCVRFANPTRQHSADVQMIPLDSDLSAETSG